MRRKAGAQVLRYYNQRVSDSRWWQYVQAVTGEANSSEIAKRMSIDPSHLTRWKGGQAPTFPFVTKFARAYGRPVLEAFVAAEFLSEEDASLHEVRIGAEELTHEQLLDELRRRLVR